MAPGMTMLRLSMRVVEIQMRRMRKEMKVNKAQRDGVRVTSSR